MNTKNTKSLFTKNLENSTKQNLLEKPYVISAGYHCNQRCLFCYNRGGRDIFPKLNYDDIVKEMEKAGDLGYTKIALFGGECTVEPYFFDVLKNAKRLNLKIRLEMNGHMFADEDFLERMKGFDFDSCQFSFHSSDEKTHDYLTQTPGAYRKVVKGILGFKKYFPQVTLDSYTVITRQNVHQMYATAQYLHKLFHVNEAFFSFLLPSSDKDQFKVLGISYKDVRPYIRKALSYLSGQHVRFRINKCPACILPEYYQHYHLEKESLEKQDYCYHDVCDICPHYAVCPGFHRTYVDEFGFDGLTFSGLSRRDLPFFFSGLSMDTLDDVKAHCTFDECHNLVFHTGAYEQEAVSICQQANIPFLHLEGKDALIDVWNDFRLEPDVVKDFLRGGKTVSSEELLDSVQRSLECDFGARIDANHILLTGGSRAALYSAFCVLLRPGEAVLLKEGMWGGYEAGVKQANARVIWVQSYKDVEKHLKSSIKFIIVNNPQIPSLRQRLSDDEMKELIRFCNTHNIFLLVDEIGNRLTPEPFSVLSLCDFSKDNVIVTHSFSKNYFIPQYRAGYVIGAPDVLKKINRLLEFSCYGISQVSLNAAYAVLNSSQDWQKERAAMIYQKGEW